MIVKCFDLFISVVSSLDYGDDFKQSVDLRMTQWKNALFIIKEMNDLEFSSHYMSVTGKWKM